MKTKELIKQLQEIDPSGELDVTIGKNTPLHFVMELPGYYDGAFLRLIRDESRSGKCYDVVGAKVVTQDHKVCLIPLEFEDMVCDLNTVKEEFILDVSDCSEYSKERYLAKLEELGQEEIYKDGVKYVKVVE